MEVGRWTRWMRRTLTGVRRYPIWYHPHYRLPVTSLESRMRLEPRRADYALWHLEQRGMVEAEDIHRPRRASYRDLARVHTRPYLESLTHADSLAPIFGADARDIQVDEVMGTIRLAVGGTVEAARHVLSIGGHALNLLGGFHHAYRDRGAGLCPVNDMAVAVAVLRAGGFTGRIGILDLDAHPPDGTADCLAGDDEVWIGSISGSDWGPLEGVDETVLAQGTGDTGYLGALKALLRRMPRLDLAMVLAGGDVLDHDHFGTLGMTMQGARLRDQRVYHALRHVPTVWLPAGGYQKSAWKVLAGTAMVLGHRPHMPVPREVDPLSVHFGRIFKGLSGPGFEPEPMITEADLADLGFGPPQQVKLMGYYTAEALEYGLTEYGVLEQVQRLGYRDIEIELSHGETGDRARISGRHGGQRHLLVELVVSRETVAGVPVLWVNWLTLRNPTGTFSDRRPRLPGQEEPGLGLSREAGELLWRMAERLGLDGVAFRPAWFHTAYAAREYFKFAEPARQARFEALMRDLLGTHSLLEITTAMADGKVTLNGERYEWEAEPMVLWRDPDDHPVPQTQRFPDVQFDIVLS